MIHYKLDIMAELERKGWSHKRIKAEKILAENTIYRIHHDRPISLDSLNNICLMLRCQPGDLIEMIPADAEKVKFFKKM